MSERALAESGRVLGARYRMVRLLGRGGMGEVWVAEHVTLGATVAVKVVRADRASGSAQAARFLREAAISAKLRHPCIVRATDYGEDGALLWYAMELLEGESLESRIEREAPLDPAAAVRLVEPLIPALAYLHAQGLVHRDLKPANVFLARVEGRAEPELRLLDFGIARDLVDGERLTTDAAILGSPAYMAPEQASGAREHGPAADQYALAVIVYEMLTGELPHGAPTLLAMLHARATEPPVPIASRRPELPAALVDAVTRALATKPDGRYASVEAFGSALRTAVREPASEPPAAVRDVATSSAPLPEAARDALPAAHAETLRATPPRGAGGSSMAVVGAAVSVLALAAALWMTRRPRSTAAETSMRSDAAVTPATIVAPSRAVVAEPVAIEAVRHETLDAGTAAVAVDGGGHPRAARRMRAETATAPRDEGSPLLRAMQGIYRALPDGGR